MGELLARYTPQGLDVQLRGPWLAEEVTTITCHERSLILIGTCTESNVGLVAGLRNMSDSQQIPSWPGAYSALLILSDSVLLRGDLAGQYPIYFHEGETDTFISSHASVIARARGLGLDRLSLSAYLACPDAAEIRSARTSFNGVRRLPAGATMQLNSSDLRMLPPTPLPDAAHTFDQAASVVGTCLRHSVDARCNRPVRISADLSGGLDSTSLAFLAARRRRPLPVFTYVNNDCPVLDDFDRALVIAGPDERFEHHVVEATSASLPYLDLGLSQDEPIAVVVGGASFRLRMSALARSRSQLHITGEGGDAVVGVTPGYLADLAAQRNLRRLRAEVQTWARLRGRRPAVIAGRAVRAARMTLRRALEELADLVEVPKKQVPVWEDGIGYWTRPGEELGWLAADCRRHLSEEIRNRAEHAYLPQRIGDYSAERQLSNAGDAARFFRLNAVPYGAALHAPYLDDDVVRACFRLTASRRMILNGPKPLLREALVLDVPATVFRRRTKGDYGAEAFLGARAARRQLVELFRSPACADIGLVDPVPVREALDRAILGLPTAWAALNRLIAIELWLREHG